MLRPDFWEIFGSEGMTPEARVALVQDRLSYLDDRAQRQFGTLMAEQLLKLGDSIVLRVVKVSERPPHSSDSALFARLAILNAGRVVFDDLSKESDRHFQNPPVVDMGAADLLSVLLGPALSELELAGQSAGASDQGDGMSQSAVELEYARPEIGLTPWWIWKPIFERARRQTLQSPLWGEVAKRIPYEKVVVTSQFEIGDLEVVGEPIGSALNVSVYESRAPSLLHAATFAYATFGGALAFLDSEFAG